MNKLIWIEHSLIGYTFFSMLKQTKKMLCCLEIVINRIEQVIEHQALLTASDENESASREKCNI